MDIRQLEQLAGLLRGLLARLDQTVTRDQSLDLVAAIPGLRDWSEVMSFPSRIDATELNLSSTSRLFNRLNSRFQLELIPEALLKAFSPPDAPKPIRLPEIWPTGPAPGVYITMSQNAIDALLVNYEEATDGALVYAEKAGDGWCASVDMSEHGLWSHGLRRVPSGTLLVVGPLKMTDVSWDDCASRLRMCCIRAQDSGHRVAVLLHSSSELLSADVEAMVKKAQNEEEDCLAALAGVVTEEGELVVHSPFARPRAPPLAAETTASSEVVPQAGRLP